MSESLEETSISENPKGTEEKFKVCYVIINFYFLLLTSFHFSVRFQIVINAS